MSGSQDELLRTVTSLEGELLKLYSEILPTLESADRTDLDQAVREDLRHLEAPDTVSPSKAIAVLKSIRGSTPEDRFQFEDCFGTKMPNGELLGAFVGDRLRQLGIGYHGLIPYLQKHGWLR